MVNGPLWQLLVVCSSIAQIHADPFHSSARQHPTPEFPWKRKLRPAAKTCKNEQDLDRWLIIWQEGLPLSLWLLDTMVPFGESKKSSQKTISKRKNDQKLWYSVVPVGVFFLTHGHSWAPHAGPCSFPAAGAVKWASSLCWIHGFQQARHSRV